MVLASIRGLHIAFCSAHIGLSDTGNRSGGVGGGLLVTPCSVNLRKDGVLTIWLAITKVRQADAGLQRIYV